MFAKLFRITLSAIENFNSFVLHLGQTMERLRAQETGIFKKKPADLMQIFKVR
jgi:sorting nexin-1/2